MSGPGGKIRSKDLAYDAELPPFLQRLRDHNAGRGDTDRHEIQIARPKRAKDPNDDDGPTVVDESGETITQQDFEKRAAAETTEIVTEGRELKDSTPVDGKAAARRVDQNITDGLTSKKRKAGKVVVDDAQDESADGEVPAVSNTTKKAKKKAKPIKLAFAADDEDR